METFDRKRLPVKLNAHVNALLEGSFLDRAENVLAFGNPGSGKTHLIKACLGLGCAALSPEAPDSERDAAKHYAVDAVQSLSQISQQSLFDLINRQQMTSGLLVASGNAAPRDLGQTF